MQKPEEDKPIALDFTGLKEALQETVKEQVKQIAEAMKPPTPAEGKGYVMPTDKSTKIIESLKKVQESGWKLTEQWTVVIPNYRQKEISANLRDYIYTTDLLMNEPGDIANIPYVADIDFEQLGAVGNAFAASSPEASLMASLTTTLYEAGMWADLSYYLIERFDQNLLEEMNKMLANAAVRSEDAKIMALVEALTDTNFAGVSVAHVGTIGRTTGSAYFYAANIPKALRMLLTSGKRVLPGECVLYLTPSAYGALLEEVIASTPIAYAAPQFITQGVIESLVGVKIVVGGYRPSQQRTNQNTGTVDLCYLMRGRRAIVLAPKRDILIETQKQIATRKLRITASHTFAIKIIDAKCICRIWTSRMVK